MKTITKKATSVLMSILITVSMMASFISISQLAVDNNVYAGVTLAWPVPGHTNLSQGLHDRNAIDISDSSISGATVVAAYGGTVKNVYKCTQQHYGSFGDCNGFGTGLVIVGDDGRTYQYAHMMANSIPANVYVGAYVATGQAIGQVGTTGYSSGNHLHFGICYGNYWEGSGNPLEETYSFTNNQPKTPAPHAHSFSAWNITKSPTCTEDGQEQRICSCGEYQIKRIPATGHDYGDWVVYSEATCEKDGEQRKACKNCGVEEIQTLEHFNHDYQHCECEGFWDDERYSYDECTRCGDIINLEIIDKEDIEQPAEPAVKDGSFKNKEGNNTEPKHQSKSSTHTKKESSSDAEELGKNNSNEELSSCNLGQESCEECAQDETPYNITNLDNHQGFIARLFESIKEGLIKLIIKLLLS